jgi:nucleotide-binding universal stress UspA family protein
MGEKILVPVTRSELSKHGLDYALKHYPDADVTALHVLESGGGDLTAMGAGDPNPFHKAVSEESPEEDSGDLSSMGPSGAEAFEEADDPDKSDEELAEELLEMVKAYAAKRGADIETDMLRGRPDRAIVQRAGEGEYDLIVIGSHGRDGVARVLLGSVAEKVVRRSPVPVLVVR